MLYALRKTGPGTSVGENKYPRKAFVLMFSKETQSEKSYPKNFSFKKLLDEIRQALIS